MKGMTINVRSFSLSLIFFYEGPYQKHFEKPGKLNLSGHLYVVFY